MICRVNSLVGATIKHYIGHHTAFTLSIQYTVHGKSFEGENFCGFHISLLNREHFPLNRLLD